MRWLMLASGIAIVLSVGLAPGQDTAPRSESAAARYDFRKIHDPHGTGKFYMDREIAQVMGHLGMGWLERPTREQEEEPQKLLRALKLKPGMMVADIGAGSGYFTFRMAPLLGPEGKVYAVDIQKEMLAVLKKRMAAAKISNVVPVLGKIDTPQLPANSIDLILMVDVYHEFSHPYEMTQAMIHALKKGGKLVFVEYRLEDPRVPILLVHRMSEKQVLREMAIHPVRHAQTMEVLPRQHIIVFEKK